MAFEIAIPRLGWSMEEGTFVRWLKKDGDFIRAGDAVFELEGEKAAQDIEAVDSGILRIPSTAPQPGAIVSVGAVIGYLVAEGEAVPATLASVLTKPSALPSKDAVPVSSEQSRSMSSTAQSDSPAASPSVRRLAREMGVKLAAVEGSGPSGRIMAKDVQTRVPKESPVFEKLSSRVASPRARRVARELGIDWHQLAGTGRDGRVRERDVRQSAAQSRPSGGASAVPMTSRRRTIANRMLASCMQTAPVTLTTRVAATNLVSLRTQLKSAGNGAVIPSYSDIIIKLVGLALEQHPMLATRTEDDRWVMPASPDEIHIGFAVDTDEGLVVPVIRHAGRIGLFDIAKASATLVEKSRSGKLNAAEMQGGVFTVTNLGSFGIDGFTPIINLPETAVLGLGRIRQEPVVVDDQIVVRDQITLSLTFDHRIVDGAPAARFLQTVSNAIENPSAWLLRHGDSA